MTSKRFVIESLLKKGRAWVSMVPRGTGFLILELNEKSPNRKLLCTPDKMESVQ